MRAKPLVQTASHWLAPLKKLRPKIKKDACEPKAVDSNGNPLKGAAKNSFLKKCEKGA